MKREIPLRLKYRTILQYGIITRKRDNKYLFTGNPFTDTPVLSAENRSRWGLVNTVYDLIKNNNE